MTTQSQTEPNPTWLSWIGWIITLLLVMAFCGSAAGKFQAPDDMVKQLADFGWPASFLLGLGILELGCAITYLIPRTSVFGAILLTGYLGGAVATHVRVGDPMYFAPVIMGVMVWLGLFLRDPRLRALLPFRKDPEPLSLLLRIPMVLIGIVVLLAVVVALQPASDFKITRSITMSAPPSEPFAMVNDFHKWDAWSPWANIDPGMKKTYEGAPSGVGAIYTWSGNSQAGEGRMTIMESKPNERIDIKLEFMRPLPATHAADFTFEPKGTDTVVTWSMSGKKDFVLKAVGLFMDMDKMLGDEFNKGLQSMKAEVEKKKGG